MISVTPAVAKFEAARAVALRGEGVREVRAAARRLRVWLQLSGLTALVDDLRWVCRETSRLRDLELFDGVLKNATTRANAERRAFTALRSRRIDGVIAALRSLPPLNASRARSQLRQWEKSLRSNTLKTDDDVHAFRKRVRRARYAYEWLGEDAKELRRLQNVLGALCDLAALSRLLTS
jgi:CHAD domain-containing protein